MRSYLLLISLSAFLFGCAEAPVEQALQKIEKSAYLDYSERDDKLSGGVRMIPVETAKGTFNVWTKRIGNNPTMKVLLLHGGPGVTHEYLESFDSYLPNAEIEYYYYDQLDSHYSDQPNDSSLWSVDRYVDEVEQVRKALGLNKDNFYLYGSSWGGILCMEYALKYQENLKGLIISNMMASIPEYNAYAHDVLGPQMDPNVLAEIEQMEANNDFANPKYIELIEQNYYPEHLLRMPLDEWPEPVTRSFSHTNADLYVTMQGPSEFGIAGNARLLPWDVKDELKNITVPVLSIGGTYDTMDPKHMEWIANEVQDGTFLLCPNGSHLSMYDDADTYFEGLIKFVKEVDARP